LKKLYTKITGIVLIIFFISNQAGAQYTTKKVKSKHQAYTDSLKQVKYDYVFPVWGQAAYQRGFDIPYPVGIMANYFFADQGILIDNFQLGFENALNPDRGFPLQPFVDSLGNPIIRFGDSRNQAWTYNVRPDVWIFPFLNVYGIFGVGGSNTEVNIASVFGNENLSFTSQVEQKISTAGFGIMAAGGIGPFWFSGDFNFTWNKPELLDEATVATVIGLRLGKTFVFKNKPQSNIAVWVGGMRVNIQSATFGAIKLRDGLPQEVWDKKDEAVNSYWDWYNNEATIPQKKIADRLVTPIVDALDNRNGESIVKYGMDKQVAEKWNMLIGVQYQLNKRWMLRSEGGIIGDRKSFLASLNYRFLL
jgi:opacity protein-like surface antigen